MRRLTILLIICIWSLCWGQNKVRWYDLTEAVKESIRVGSDSITSIIDFIVTDTTVLKSLTDIDNGTICYLFGLSESNILGGGFFILTDSAYIEGAIAFDNTTVGKQWVRIDYLRDKCAYLEWFGAIGDNITNDRNALYNAFSSGFQLIGTSGKIYYMATGVAIGDKDISLRSSGAEKFTIRGDTTLANSAILINFSGSLGSSTTPSDTIKNNIPYISVTDPSLFSIGDVVLIKTTYSWHDIAGVKGEIHRIDLVHDDTLFFEDKIWDVYDPSTETITVTKVNTIKLRLENFIIKLDTLTVDLDSPIGFLTSYAEDALIKNVEIVNFEKGNAYVQYFYNMVFENCNIVNASEQGFGYGILAAGGDILSIQNSTFFGNNHGIDLSGGIPTRNVRIEHNYFMGPGHWEGSTLELYGCGIHTHDITEGVVISNNTFVDCAQGGIIFKGTDAFITDNSFYGYSLCCIQVAQHTAGYHIASNVVIDNNYYSPSIMGKSSIVDTSLYYNTCPTFITLSQVDTSDYTYYTITNNKAFMIQDYFIYLSGTGIIKNFNVSNNIVRFYNPVSTETCYFIAYSSNNIEDYKILDNDIVCLSSNTLSYGSAMFHFHGWTAANSYYIGDTLSVPGLDYTAGVIHDYFWDSNELNLRIGDDSVGLGVKDAIYSLDFEKSNSDVVYIIDTSFVEINDEDFVMGCWIKPESFTEQMGVYAQYLNGYTFGGIYLTGINYNKPVINFEVSEGYPDSILIETASDSLDTNWHWLAFSINRDDTAKCFIYIDGDTVSSYKSRTSGSTASFLANTAWPTFGKGTSAAYYDGMMYNFVFWKDTTLSYSDNQLIYNMGKNAPLEKAIGNMPIPNRYFKFQEGTGVSTYDMIENTLGSVQYPDWVKAYPNKISTVETNYSIIDDSLCVQSNLKIIGDINLGLNVRITMSDSLYFIVGADTFIIREKK